MVVGLKKLGNDHSELSVSVSASRAFIVLGNTSPAILGVCRLHCTEQDSLIPIPFLLSLHQSLLFTDLLQHVVVASFTFLSLLQATFFHSKSDVLHNSLQLRMTTKALFRSFDTGINHQAKARTLSLHDTKEVLEDFGPSGIGLRLFLLFSMQAFEAIFKIFDIVSLLLPIIVLVHDTCIVCQLLPESRKDSGLRLLWGCMPLVTIIEALVVKRGLLRSWVRGTLLIRKAMVVLRVRLGSIAGSRWR